MEKHISRMFNCYSGSGVAGGQAPQLHFPCSQPAQRTTLPPPRTACLYFSTAIPLFPPFSPSLPSNLFHPSTVHRLLFSRPPLAHVRFSALSAAVSINLPSLTLFNGVRSPLARRYFRPKLRFEPLPLRFHFARIAVDVQTKNLCALRLAASLDRLLDFDPGVQIEKLTSFFIFLVFSTRNWCSNWKGISRLLLCNIISQYSCEL